MHALAMPSTSAHRETRREARRRLRRAALEARRRARPVVRAQLRELLGLVVSLARRTRSDLESERLECLELLLLEAQDDLRWRWRELNPEACIWELRRLRKILQPPRRFRKKRGGEKVTFRVLEGGRHRAPLRGCTFCVPDAEAGVHRLCTFSSDPDTGAPAAECDDVEPGWLMMVISRLPPRARNDLIQWLREKGYLDKG